MIATLFDLPKDPEQLESLLRALPQNQLRAVLQAHNVTIADVSRSLSVSRQDISTVLGANPEGRLSGIFPKMAELILQSLGADEAA